MSRFTHRTAASQALISALQEAFWARREIARRGIHHVAYGYEVVLPPEIQRAMRTIYSPTALHVRFTPDFLLVVPGGGVRGSTERSDPVLLLEYKVTATPRYSAGAAQWSLGQIEADAWESYLRLTEAGLQVAIVIYCPFHPRPLLCGRVEESWITRGRTIVRASTGSGTPYVNVDLEQIATFEEFALEALGIPSEVSAELLSAPFYRRLRAEPLLQTQHDAASPHHGDSSYGTGFNWLARYAAAALLDESRR
jgi:hypothetical protein